MSAPVVYGCSAPRGCICPPSLMAICEHSYEEMVTVPRLMPSRPILACSAPNGCICGGPPARLGCQFSYEVTTAPEPAKPPPAPELPKPLTQNAFEGASVYGEADWIEVKEVAKGQIRVAIRVTSVSLTPRAARVLARQLLRAARRQEAR